MRKRSKPSPNPPTCVHRGVTARSCAHTEDDSKSWALSSAASCGDDGEEGGSDDDGATAANGSGDSGGEEEDKRTLSPEEELALYEAQLEACTRSLAELDLGLKGDLTMSDPMEKLMMALADGAVYSGWAKLAYPSLRSLGSWVNNLERRVEQLAQCSDRLCEYLRKRGSITGHGRLRSENLREGVDERKRKFGEN